MANVYDEPFAVRGQAAWLNAGVGLMSPLWALYAGSVAAGLSFWSMARWSSFDAPTAAPSPAPMAQEPVAREIVALQAEPAIEAPVDPRVEALASEIVHEFAPAEAPEGVALPETPLSEVLDHAAPAALAAADVQSAPARKRKGKAAAD